MTPPTGMTHSLMLYLVAIKVSIEGIRTTAVLQAIEMPAVDDEGLLRYIDLCLPCLYACPHIIVVTVIIGVKRLHTALHLKWHCLKQTDFL